MLAGRIPPRLGLRLWTQKIINFTALCWLNKTQGNVLTRLAPHSSWTYSAPVNTGLHQPALAATTPNAAGYRVTMSLEKSLRVFSPIPALCREKIKLHRDLKSPVRKDVPVRFRLRAPNKSRVCTRFFVQALCFLFRNSESCSAILLFRPSPWRPAKAQNPKLISLPNTSNPTLAAACRTLSSLIVFSDTGLITIYGNRTPCLSPSPTKSYAGT